MNKSNKTSKTVCRTLVAMLLLVLPAGSVYAQLFGGHLISPKIFTITIPGTITLAQNRMYIIESVYDLDYIPYTAPSAAATTATQAADGVNETKTLNIQGTISTTGINLKLPVTTTGSDILPAYSKTVNVPASLTQDGISRDITFSWAQTSYTTSTKSITVNIKALGGTLNVKKLDINAGIGTDYLGIMMGAFVYPYNNAGNTTTFLVRDLPGIPDKMIGQTDNSGTKEHEFLYTLVQGEDGNVWLNNNLGSDYSNINHASFSPAQQATAYNDQHAYGSLFQWGRKPDGHELINWTGPYSATPKYSFTTAQSDNPINTLFIKNINNWRVTPDATLWAAESSPNNPCPIGFRLPDPIDVYMQAAGITDYYTAASCNLALTTDGYRSTSTLDDLQLMGYDGWYWTKSSNNLPSVSILHFTKTTCWSSTLNASFGLSVRCVKN